MNTNEIKKIFKLYGYDVFDETSTYIVFAVRHSIYPGVDIVLLEDIDPTEVQTLEDMYSKQRYAVRVCRANDMKMVEDFLFDSFFQVEATNKQIGVRYREYGRSIIASYGIPEDYNAEYSYIESPYYIEEDITTTQRGPRGELVSSITEEIAKPGATLIIVEAAAGFGKTSTALEILKHYENTKHGIRPFYMELAKDRQAATFRYLLLSQMHREFNVLLGDEIVDYNIKKGRIPLIIDGFDELLSEDLDTGNVLRAKRRGETMLSTIAEYLQGDAKIILTTRRTAILSGEDFFEWYINKLSNGHIRLLRYSLEQPSVADWLDARRIKLIQRDIDNILNPVLLGYLHYLSDVDYDKECKSAQLINCYISKLLNREIDRQHLPFSVEEQKIIYSNLAVAFAYDDIMSESRSNVKDYISLLSGEIIAKHITIGRDVDSLMNTLANHALLDRKGNNNIGFVNDFVLGVFIGLAMLNERNKDLIGYYKEMSIRFLDKVLMAMSLSSETDRDTVWMLLVDNCSNLSSQMRLQADLMLQRRAMSSYEDQTFDGNNYVGITLGDTEATFKNCHFANMSFTDSCINVDNFSSCEFINCVFNNTSINIDSPDVDFIQCYKDGELIPMYVDVNQSENVENADTDLWVEMLSQYSLVGNTGRRMQLISRIRNNYEDKKLFKKVFSQLVAKNFILTNGDKSHISTQGLEYLSKHRKNG